MVVAGHCSKLVITAWDEDLKTLETLANLRFMVMRVVFFVFNTSLFNSLCAIFFAGIEFVVVFFFKSFLILKIFSNGGSLVFHKNNQVILKPFNHFNH